MRNLHQFWKHRLMLCKCLHNIYIQSQSICSLLLIFVNLLETFLYFGFLWEPPLWMMILFYSICLGTVSIGLYILANNYIFLMYLLPVQWKCQTVHWSSLLQCPVLVTMVMNSEGWQKRRKLKLDIIRNKVKYLPFSDFTFQQRK